SVVDARNGAGQRERAAGDAGAGNEGDDGLGLEPVRRGAVLGEETRKLHGEAARMGRCGQLFGNGGGLAAFVLEAGLERIGAGREDTALGVDRASAFLEVALPYGGCVAVHGRLPELKVGTVVAAGRRVRKPLALVCTR